VKNLALYKGHGFINLSLDISGYLCYTAFIGGREDHKARMGAR
jgi:hypothetical protein